MRTDRTKRYERWNNALKWGLIGVLWTEISYVTPDIPFFTFQSEFPSVHLTTIVFMGSMGYLFAWLSHWWETPEAVGPDELDMMDSDK